MGTITPTIRLRRLGLALRDHREKAGLTLDDAARILKRSVSSLSRVENGQQCLRVRDLEYILDKYGVTDPAVTDRLYDWCRNARKKGWWQKYAADLSPETMDIIGLESDAASIDFFELIVIPGIFQTEAYARALIGIGPYACDPAQVDRLVAVRMKRQEIVTKPSPPKLWAIIDEAALRRQVGGQDVMRDQFCRLIEISELPHATVQVLPFGAGAYQGMSGAFIIIEVGDRGDLQIALVDSLTQMSFREDDQEIVTYTSTFNHLRATALSGGESKAFIERLLSET